MSRLQHGGQQGCAPRAAPRPGPTLRTRRRSGGRGQAGHGEGTGKDPRRERRRGLGGGGRLGARTRLSPESTSRREMRLWPSRRSSYRSLMCLCACRGRGLGWPQVPRTTDRPRGHEAGAHRRRPPPRRHLPLPSSATQRDQERWRGGGGGQRQEAGASEGRKHTEKDRFQRWEVSSQGREGWPRAAGWQEGCGPLFGLESQGHAASPPPAVSSAPATRARNAGTSHTHVCACHQP